MKKSLQFLTGCLSILCISTVCQAQGSLGDIINGAANGQATGNAVGNLQTPTNNALQAGLQGAANAAINGEDVRGSIQEGIRGAAQNSAQSALGVQGNGQTGLNQNGLQGGLQSNGQTGLTVRNSNGQLGAAANGQAQQNLRTRLTETIQVNGDGTIQFRDGRQQQLQAMGLQSNDQILDSNGRVVTNVDAITSIGQQNGEYRILRNGQIYKVKLNQQQHGVTHDHQAQQSQYRSSESIEKKLNEIERLVGEVRAELSANKQ